MAGTKEGGRKAAATNKEKHGADFYKKIGKMGGSKSHPETRPFTLNPELAKRCGRNGGTKSRRGPVKHPRSKKTVEEAPAKKKGILGWFSGRKGR